MDQHPTDSSIPVQDEGKSIDSWLKALWERTRLAGELIVRLRHEKGVLQSRAEDLEKQVTLLRQELTKKEDQIKKMESERVILESQKSGVFSNGEREALGVKLRDLLAKINAYL